MQGCAVAVLSEIGAFGRKSSAGNKSSSVHLECFAFGALGYGVAHECLAAATAASGLWPMGMGLGVRAGGHQGLSRARLPPGGASCCLHPPAASVRDVSLLGKGACRGQRQSREADPSGSRRCFHTAAAGAVRPTQREAAAREPTSRRFTRRRRRQQGPRGAAGAAPSQRHRTAWVGPCACPVPWGWRTGLSQAALSGFWWGLGWGRPRCWAFDCGIAESVLNLPTHSGCCAARTLEVI